MLQKGVNELPSILDQALTLARKELDPQNPKKAHGYDEFKKHVNVKSLKELDLDEVHSIGYTYKCLGSAIYTLKHGDDFKQAISELVREAGDADTYVLQ
jgi:hypothetical protein